MNFEIVAIALKIAFKSRKMTLGFTVKCVTQGKIKGVTSGV